MPRDPEKIRENRLRRAAERQGLFISKSRRRDPQALDYGKYWLCDIPSGVLIAGGDWGMSLDAVEDWLSPSNQSE